MIEWNEFLFASTFSNRILSLLVTRESSLVDSKAASKVSELQTWRLQRDMLQQQQKLARIEVKIDEGLS